MADSEQRVTRLSSKSRPPRRSMSADNKPEPLPAELAAHFVSDIDLVHPQKPSFGAACSKNPSDGASVQSEERGQQEAQSDGRSSKTGKTGKQAKCADALSRSALGASLWLAYPPLRNCLSQSVPRNSRTQTDRLPKELEIVTAESNEMLGFYEEMTKYMKPPTAKHGLPVVDKRVESVRERFHSQVYELPAGPNTRELPQEFWKVISGSLSSLLWASVGVYSLENSGKGHNEDLREGPSA
ncbi:hypothetical protein IW262DRAFT_1456480 [Armillaria fumosa]|nr:hypothetical protein IW262DRAFT_1456480 [Armillaria fumosa]